VLLVRAAAKAGASTTTETKYVAPATRRAAARTDETSDGMSERMIWDALDEGRDPTGVDEQSDGGLEHDSDNEGR
jgi:uncharacterized membrane protein (TIGR02234 family)